MRFNKAHFEYPIRVRNRRRIRRLRIATQVPNLKRAKKRRGRALTVNSPRETVPTNFNVETPLEVMIVEVSLLPSRSKGKRECLQCNKGLNDEGVVL